MQSFLRSIASATFLFTAASVSGCSSSADEGTGVATPSFFVAGHGVRAIQSISIPNDFTVRSYRTADISLSAPGTLEWVYGLTSSSGNVLTRRTVDLASGTTLVAEGSLKSILPKNLQEEDAILFVPYTNQLFNLAGASPAFSIQGEISFPSVGADGTRDFHAYANGDLLFGAKTGYYDNGGGQYSSDLVVHFQPSGGALTKSVVRHVVPRIPSEDKRLYRAGRFERIATGEVLGFFVSGEVIRVERMSDEVELASIPYDGLSEVYASPITPIRLRSKISKDGNRVAAYLLDRNSLAEVPRVTTFTYDVPSKTISVVLRDLAPELLTTFEDFYDVDLDGNFYFAAHIDPMKRTGQRIVKQTATSQSVIATGFIPDDADSGFGFLKVIDDKVFVGIGGGGLSGSKSTDLGPSYVLGVID